MFFFTKKFGKFDFFSYFCIKYIEYEEIIFFLSEKELSDIVKTRVQGIVDSLTDSIVREIARKNNLNKMQYLWQENNLDCSSCGSSSDGGCGSSNGRC